MLKIQHNRPMSRLAPAARYFAVCGIMLAASVFAFASKGGGEKKKHADFDEHFTPINTVSSFTLRNTVNLYSGSSISSAKPTADNRVSLNAMITYQKGNTTFILPFQYKANIGPASGGRSNLQLFGVKIQMPH